MVKKELNINNYFKNRYVFSELSHSGAPTPPPPRRPQRGVRKASAHRAASVEHQAARQPGRWLVVSPIPGGVAR